MSIKSIFHILDQSFLTGHDPVQKQIEEILKKSNQEALLSDMMKVQRDMQTVLGKHKKRKAS